MSRWTMMMTAVLMFIVLVTPAVEGSFQRFDQIFLPTNDLPNPLTVDVRSESVIFFFFFSSSLSLSILLLPLC